VPPYKICAPMPLCVRARACVRTHICFVVPHFRLAARFIWALLSYGLLRSAER